MKRYDLALGSMLFVPVLCGSLLFAEEIKNEKAENDGEERVEVEIVKNLELLENFEILRDLDFFKYLPFLELQEGEEEL